MKIVHVISGLGDGGAEGVLFRLVSEDSTNQHIVISMMGLGKYGPMLQDLGITVHCLGMRRGAVSFKGLRTLKALIRVEQPNVVQTWMYHANLIGGIISKMEKVKHISWGIRHGEITGNGLSASTKFVSRLSGYLSARVPDTIIYCAESAQSEHESYGYKAGKGTVIPNGYNLEVFYPEKTRGLETRRQLGIPPGTLLLGFVARFDPNKDHKNLLTALSIVDRLEPGLSYACILVGTGMDADNLALSEMMQSLASPSKVLLIGQRNDIPNVMRSLDIHILPSSSEGFPNVVAEAMATGTPCIVTDVGDAALIVGETGWVVPSQNPELLAEKIIQAANEFETSKWEVRRLSAIRRIEEHYTVARMVSSYVDSWIVGTDT